MLSRMFWSITASTSPLPSICRMVVPCGFCRARHNIQVRHCPPLYVDSAAISSCGGTVVAFAKLSAAVEARLRHTHELLEVPGRLHCVQPPPIDCAALA